MIYSKKHSWHNVVGTVTKRREKVLEENVREFVYTKITRRTVEITETVWEVLDCGHEQPIVNKARARRRCSQCEESLEQN